MNHKERSASGATQKSLQWKRSLGAITAAVLIGLAGCTLRQQTARPAPAAKDIHERLALVSTQEGFSHGIHSQRGAENDVDYIFIHFTLDSLKRRHYTLVNLMKNIGSICAQPEFADLQIRIEIRAADERDRIYLKDSLATAISGKANIEVLVKPTTYNGIIVSVIRPH